MRRTIGWMAAGACCLGAGAILAAYSIGTSPPRARTVDLVETVRVAPPPEAKDVRLWIPRPPSQGPQSAELVSVESPFPYQVTAEPEFGNQTVYLHGRQPRPFEVKLRYRVTRKPQGEYAGTSPSTADQTPRGLLVIDDEIHRIAREQTRGAADPMGKAVALYRYVLKRMVYDKSGQGWGRGDSIYACRVGKGNCTDFHSLFMALAIASGIPARFRMGLSLPEAPEGTVSGYHCWAEFYAKGSWIPVDISEAWKNPNRADYYFGHLDVNRVLVSTGREIRLSPPQKGPRLNFFHRPYAEADGQPLYDIEFIRSYKDTGGRV